MVPRRFRGDLWVLPGREGQLQSGQSGLIRMTLPRPYLLRQLGAGGTRPADVAAEAVVPLLRVKGEVVA